MDSIVKDQLERDLEVLISVYTSSIAVTYVSDDRKDLIEKLKAGYYTHRGICYCMCQNLFNENHIILSEIEDKIYADSNNTDYLCIIPQECITIIQAREALQFRLDFLNSLKTKYFEQ